MPRQLIFSQDAIEDLKGIRQWQTQPGFGRQAKRRLQNLLATTQRLKRNPCLYPVCDRPGIREMPADGEHRVFYTVIPDTGRSSTAGIVTILRIFGPGRSRESL